MNWEGLFRDWGFIGSLYKKLWVAYWLEMVILLVGMFIVVLAFLRLVRWWREY